VTHESYDEIIMCLDHSFFVSYSYGDYEVFPVIDSCGCGDARTMVPRLDQLILASGSVLIWMGATKMESQRTPHAAANDLVIVVLNELACAGKPSVCGTGADYAGTMPAAIAA
jgi:hypothetical protein